MTQIKTITTALEQAINGEPAPAFGSADFRELVSAVTALTAPGIYIDPQALLMHEQVGRAAMGLLLGRYHSSMVAEREITLLRDMGKDVC